MRKVILLLALNFICIHINYSQIALGEEWYKKNSKPIEESILKELKSTTTIFVARDNDDLEVLEEELKKVWTITPLIVIKYKDYQLYLNKEDYSFFEIQGHFISNGKNFCTYVYLILYLNRINKKGKSFEYKIAKMELHPDIETILTSIDNEENEFSDHIYTEAKIYNWYSLSIINFVRQVNDHLIKKESRNFLDKSYKANKLSKLARETLYVPDYILRKFNPFNKTEDKFYKAEELFSAYDYKYKIVTNEELLEKFLNKEGSFYYLSTVKSCNQVFINVVDGSTGDIIYSDHPKLWSYNIKSKDLTQLRKTISKAKKSTKR